MLTDEARLIDEIRRKEKENNTSRPSFIDGLQPYCVENVRPVNPLSYTTRMRTAVPVGDNGTLVVVADFDA
ncbi:MAG: hypothetical protein JW941_03195 [Candidatus Coatesbacteria bacterium]|nr:hypothetical protein [Candidatus Coatesbacteria bacterium]